MKLATTLALFSAGMVCASASIAAPTCSIEIHPRFNLYVISVDGKPFKNKHYVDYDDAALLQRVLVDAGDCVPVQKVAKCDSRGNTGSRKNVLLAGATTGSTKKRTADAAQLSWSSSGCAGQ